MEYNDVYEFSLGVKKLYTEAAKKYGEDLRRINFYPRVHHDVNKFFFSKGSRSYRVMRLANMGLLRKVKSSPQHTVDVKSKAYNFAELCGVKCPKAVAGLTLDQLVFDKLVVSKPVFSNGGKSIYAWKRSEDGSYYDYYSKKVAVDIAHVKKIMRQDFLRRKIKVDEWIQEELIVGKDGTPKSTYDVKFYTFYGKIAVILQVDRWDKKQYSFFDLNGVQVETGRYPLRENAVAVFDKQMIDVAVGLSKKIPWPHVRLDFLVSDNDYAFGEFSSDPGNFSEFNDAWDHKLGLYYQGGFERLHSDFLNRKDFSEYKSCFGPFGDCS